MKAIRIGAAATVLAAVLFGAGALTPLGPTPTPASPQTFSRTGALSDNASTEAAGQALELLRRSRAEADPTLLPQAEALLDRSFALQPRKNFAASLGMASLANATHDFSASVKWANRAIRMNPYNASPYGVLGDALFELGRYEAADAAYQRMVDIRPDVASYIRASYAAQSHNRWDVAEYTLKLAIQAAPFTGEEAAFVRHQLGDVYASQGDFDLSLRQNRIGTRLAAGYVPPTVGIAEAHIGRNRLGAAVPIMERAVAKLPSLEYLVTLGDLYWARGDYDRALTIYDQVAVKLDEYRDNGVLPDVDFLLFYADHGYRLEAGMTEAVAVYGNRPTSATADALAWMLRANGRDRQAWRYAREALDLARTPDATQHFHAGVIALETGREATGRRLVARALRLDPNFSLFHRATARRLIARASSQARVAPQYWSLDRLLAFQLLAGLAR